MEFASSADVKEIMDMYGRVVEKVNTTPVRLGWNTDVYPDVSFVNSAVENGEMCILKEDGRITAAAVVNHEVNPEYDTIDWEIKCPKERIATIHALAVTPEKQGGRVSHSFLADIEDYCREKGDLAIHLDVIDTNIPAYKLYVGNGYKEKACIRMYYEVVGSREFWMMEHVL
ncbi:MAG: GNAT family N-acetyltransferase [Lachnospiraceae bacterium]|nr:GNAT family N-acetyltransferase [Lachnospiraceae bacterium]